MISPKFFKRIRPNWSKSDSLTHKIPTLSVSFIHLCVFISLNGHSFLNLLILMSVIRNGNFPMLVQRFIFQKCLKLLISMNIVRSIPASILYKSTVGRYRSVSYPDGPITARYRFFVECLQGYCKLTRTQLLHERLTIL